MMPIAFVVAAMATCGTRATKAPLPDVDTVLTKANSRARAFAAQALAMQQRVSEQQEIRRAALKEQKKRYEDHLDQVHRQSEAIHANNTELLHDNGELERQNGGMVADLKKLQERNSELRLTLKNITDKVLEARLFIRVSLNVTDDSRAKELQALVPTTPKPTLDDFLEGLSLLAISSVTHRHDPAEAKKLVSSLSSSLGEIKLAEDEGAAALKAQFLAKFEQMQERQALLNTTRAELLRTTQTLLDHRKKLLAAQSHLLATNKELTVRLNGLRFFADKVEGNVNASLQEDATRVLQTQSNTTNGTYTSTVVRSKATATNRTNATPAYAYKSATASWADSIASPLNVYMNAAANLAAASAARVVATEKRAFRNATTVVAKVAGAAKHAVTTRAAPAHAIPADAVSMHVASAQNAPAEASAGGGWTSWLAFLR